MEQMINIVISTISTICIGLITNYISDKLKSHSTSSKTKSSFEINVKLNKFNLNIKKRKF
ncbi:MAG: hypothetical protein IJ086_15160 [Clostridium sp.]|nr:hypothetical protein [Clostridium sp.]